MNTLTTTKQALPADVTAQVQAALDESHAGETRRVYASGWKAFCAWLGSDPGTLFVATPQQVAAYLAERGAQGASISTLRVARAAIRFHFLEQGFPDPTNNEGVARVLRGLSRKAARTGNGVQKQAQALTAEGLAAIVATACTPRKRGRGMETADVAERRGRVDIALVSLMRDALLRRSEVIALRWHDVEREANGSGRVHVRFGKTDQDGAGSKGYVSRQTMERLDAIRNGAADGERIFGFRSGQAVRDRIVSMCKAAGLSGEFSGHSPRVGMARDLVRAGTELPALMQAGRWKSERMPAHYARNELAGRGAVAKYYGEA